MSKLGQLRTYLNLMTVTNESPRRTYINFKHENWARCVDACDKYLAEAGEQRTVEQDEWTFRKAVNKANGLFINIRKPTIVCCNDYCP